ncbi:MerR family transcriptional regulator [Amycolatopsis thermophila]|uniref:DNA-binding transcriptional MerR regulator n=1 Tax=Amycolatopsis thermophila TaxID=206084 RepID=A0ABU0EX14_9PSEU|nr:MerR family transcriptional regulator [Amycolatopsis thermophila]MDQ0379859.1 DNA-binding transcriptional MerR regulator [Amycolatopsis thermophila]
MTSHKVGELAKATGLTVRTLHHYDHVGLVRPSGRTASGHRLYDESDVRRLYAVLALRQLGLPLEDIGAALAGTSGLGELLTRHREHLDRQLVAIRTLHAHLTTMLATLDDGVGVTDFLALIREVTTVDETVKQYFSEAQLAELAERRSRLGGQEDVQRKWQDLIPRVQRAIDTGTDPASTAGRALAAEWMSLLEAFHGGDPGLRDSLYRMQADNSERIRREHGGPSPEQLDFIRRANAAS